MYLLHFHPNSKRSCERSCSIWHTESINQSLERDCQVGLESQEVKRKSKSVDDLHCHPIGRGKMEKTTKFGVQYTAIGKVDTSSKTSYANAITMRFPVYLQYMCRTSNSACCIKKAAKPLDPEESVMASHSETLLDMQDQAKKRRTKLLEKES